jgi:alpha-beta hydrolase superfamily lysophospholipase
MIGMDLRGHGLSSGTRGHTAPRIDVLNDIDLMIQYAQARNPNTPIFLYGHSMGGNIALDYRKRGKNRLTPKSYIITSPWLVLQRKIPFYLYGFSKLMSMVKPDFRMNTEINPAVLGNVEIIMKQENQHLVHGSITVKTALEGLAAADELLHGGAEAAGGQDLRPFLLMHGDLDKICSPDGSRKLAELEKERCTYIEWEGLYHEIHNGNSESDGMEVIKAMLNWIQDHLEAEDKNAMD